MTVDAFAVLGADVTGDAFAVLGAVAASEGRW